MIIKMIIVYSLFFCLKTSKGGLKMSWNEQDHPRDDDGKFTFKNGGDNKNKQIPAEILYKNSKIKKEEEMIKQKEKNKLLDALGDKATLKPRCPSIALRESPFCISSIMSKVSNHALFCFKNQ